MKTTLLARIMAAHPTTVWTPSDFLDLGARDAVDKTLQRLTRAGSLRRIGRGLYDQPSMNTLTKKPNPPDPRQIVDAIARRDQLRLLVDGMTAANDLGFTNAVPAKIIVHTDARARTIVLDRLQIVFKPTAASKLYWAGRPAMRIVQALHWLRDTLGDLDEDRGVIERLRSLLQHPQEGARLRVDLVVGLATLPTWMQAFLQPLITEADAA